MFANYKRIFYVKTKVIHKLFYLKYTGFSEKVDVFGFLTKHVLKTAYSLNDFDTMWQVFSSAFVNTT